MNVRYHALGMVVGKLLLRSVEIETIRSLKRDGLNSSAISRFIFLPPCYIQSVVVYLSDPGATDRRNSQ